MLILVETRPNEGAAACNLLRVLVQHSGITDVWVGGGVDY